MPTGWKLMRSSILSPVGVHSNTHSQDPLEYKVPACKAAIDGCFFAFVTIYICPQPLSSCTLLSYRY